MRITVDKNDPAFDPAALPHAYTCNVYIDGVLTHDCITADEALGEAVVYARDESGQLILNTERDAVICKTVRGVIRIEAHTS